MGYTKQGTVGVLVGETITGIRNIANKPYYASKVTPKVYYDQKIDPVAGKSRITLQVKIAFQDGGYSFVNDAFFIGGDTAAGLYVNGVQVLVTSISRGDVTISYAGAGEYSFRKGDTEYTYTFETSEKSFSVELRSIGGRDQAPQHAAQMWSVANLAYTSIRLESAIAGTIRVSDGVTVSAYQLYISDGTAWHPYRAVVSSGTSWEDMA